MIRYSADSAKGKADRAASIAAINTGGVSEAKSIAYAVDYDASSPLSGSGAPSAGLGGFGDQYIDQDSGDFYVKDIFVYDNICSSGTPSCGPSNGGLAGNIVDGNTATNVALDGVSPYSAWFQFDRGAGNEATVVRLRTYTTYAGSHPEFWLYGSNNGSDWDQLLYVASNPGGNVWNQYDVSNSTAYRYYRMNISSWDTINLSEVELLAFNTLQWRYVTTLALSEATSVADSEIKSSANLALSFAQAADSLADRNESILILENSVADLAISYAILADSEMEEISSALSETSSLAVRAESIAQAAGGSLEASEARSVALDAESVADRVHSIAARGNSFAEAADSTVDRVESIAVRGNSFAEVADSTVDRVQSIATRGNSFAEVGDSVADRAESIALVGESKATLALSLARV